MGIFTIPATGNVCEILSGMSDKEVIFPTADADWHGWSACDVGTKIAAVSAVVSENYEYVVLDRSDNCVKRSAKPVAPVTYDSNLLGPWIGRQGWSGELTGGATPDVHPEFDMNLPEFTTDVWLLAGWTIGRKNGSFEWIPKGPDQTIGVGYGTGYVALSPTLGLGSAPTTLYWERTFCRRIFVKGSTAGLKLGIYHNSMGGQGYARMTAIAFKA